MTKPLLPLELLFIIIDFAAIYNFNLHTQCNPFNFPDISLHLRFPWKRRRTTDPELLNLRLVCRAFYVHLESSTHFFMEGSSSAIPMVARAVYIRDHGAQELLPKLIDGFFNSHQIVTLDIPGGGNSKPPQPMMFDTLCRNSSSFSGVRNLALGLHNYCENAAPNLKFWGRLNKAFPHLVSLVLRGYLYPASKEPVVVFSSLEILQLDLVYLSINVWFPVLRHATFSQIPPDTARNFTGWPLLESLMIPDDQFLAFFDWSSAPRLQVLGIRCTELNAFAPLSQQYQLVHLFIYVGVTWSDYNNDKMKTGEVRLSEDLSWVKLITKRIPSISRITFAYERTTDYSRSIISRDFDEEEVNALGFSLRYTNDERYDDSSWVIIDRMPISPELESRKERPEKPGSKRNGIRERWDRFSSRFLP